MDLIPYGVEDQSIAIGDPGENLGRCYCKTCLHSDFRIALTAMQVGICLTRFGKSEAREVQGEFFLYIHRAGGSVLYCKKKKEKSTLSSAIITCSSD